MNESKLVVDTNIFFSLLLRRDTSARRRFLTDITHTFYSPRFFVVELFKHKERSAEGAGTVNGSAARKRQRFNRAGRAPGLR